MGARASGESACRTARVAIVVLAGLAPALGADLALAASDSTFAGPLNTVTGMVSGTGGQLAAALAVGAALVGSVLRFTPCSSWARWASAWPRAPGSAS